MGVHLPHIFTPFVRAQWIMTQRISKRLPRISNWLEHIVRAQRIITKRISKHLPRISNWLEQRFKANCPCSPASHSECCKPVFTPPALRTE